MDRYREHTKRQSHRLSPSLQGNLLYYIVRLVASIFKAVLKENGRTAYAAAKVMIPSRAPDPLSTAFPCVARLSLYP